MQLGSLIFNSKDKFTFQWTAAAGAASYRFSLIDDYGSVVKSGVVTGETHTETIHNQDFCTWQVEALDAVGKEHAEAEFRVVFKQGIGPCRSAAPAVDGIGNAGHGRAPGLGTARGVGPVGPRPEKLGEKSGVGRFAAARTGGGKFQKRPPELASLHAEGVEDIGLFRQA